MTKDLLSKHTNDKPHFCEIRKICFTKIQSSLIDGNKFHTKEVTLPGVSQTKSVKKRKHGKRVHRLECDVCQKYFSSQSDLDRHINGKLCLRYKYYLERNNTMDLGGNFYDKTHTGVTIYDNEYCQTNFAAPISLNRHKTGTQYQNDYRRNWFAQRQCEYCKISFSTQSDLNKHTFVCEFRKKFFTNRHSLGLTKQVKNQTKETLGPPYLCEYCQTILLTQNYLKDHTFVCELRNKFFAKRQSFQWTEQVPNQTKEKLGPQYLCEYCQIFFTTQRDLNKHTLLCELRKKFFANRQVQNHTGETSYPCMYCQTFFKTQSDLNKHSFMCEFRKKVFANRQSLQLTEQSHKEDRLYQYQCDHCRTTDFNKHTSTCHLLTNFLVNK